MQNFFENILNIVFPKMCIACNTSGEYICNNCIDRVERLTTQPHKSERIFIVYSFENKLVKEVLKLFKYKSAQSVAIPFSEKLYDFIQETMPKKEEGAQYALIPIPTTKKRIRQRGYNQADLLAKHLVKKYPEKFFLHPILKKKSSSSQQTALNSRGARIKNSENMFEIIGTVPQDVALILIDDIVTTGATMRSAQNILQKNSSQKIYGFAVAYQPKKEFEI